MLAFFAFLVATFVTIVLIPPLRRAAEARGLFDMPSDRKVHRMPIPRVGGIAMAVGALLPVMMWAPIDARTRGYLAGVAVLLVFGVLDDIKDLGYRLKFAGQLAAVLLVTLHGGVVVHHLPFMGAEPLPDPLAIAITVFALVGVTNAVNLADGLDGLAGGISLLSLGIIAILSQTTDDPMLLLATTAAMGSIVGFLRFNTFPARVFMGDSGSQFLGFSTGVLVIVLTQQTNSAVSAALPLLILGLPLLDTGLVMAKRLYEGRSPFRPDKLHIHHKLLALGFDHYEAVIVIYLLQALLVACAYLLRFEADTLVVGAYAAFCVGLVAWMRRATRTRWRAHTPHAPLPARPRWVEWLRRDQRLLKIAFAFAVAAISCYLFVSAMLVAEVPADVGALALGLLAVLLALFSRRRHQPFSLVERAGLYIAGVCIVYLDQAMPGALARVPLYREVLFVAMALAVAIGFRFSAERFRITPMDVLIVIVAMLVPNIPEIRSRWDHIGTGVAMLIVLFYSIELVLTNLRWRWDVMRYATYATLAVLGLRGVAGLST